MWMLSRVVICKQSKWFLASSPSRDTCTTCRETKGMKNCYFCVTNAFLRYSSWEWSTTQKILIKLYWLPVSPQQSLTNPFGAAVPAAMEGEIHPVLTVIGGGVQLRLNRPTWLLSAPLNNPLRGSGTMGATALPQGRPILPHRPWERWYSKWVEAWGHLRGGWACCIFQAVPKLGWQGEPEKLHGAQFMGTFREATGLRQRWVQVPTRSIF